MILGIDTGTHFDEVNDKAKYYKDGKEVDPYLIFKNNGITYSRLRLWVDPFSKDGKPYGAGTNDLKTTIKLAKLMQNYGFHLYLDFHYSDFWADPSKQFIPKSWVGLSLEELIKKIYEYTYETLTIFKKEGIHFDAIQTGNEITNGMLWPIGKLKDNPDGSRSNYESLFSLLKSAGKAVRDFDKNIKIIIHLESAHQKNKWIEYFTYLESHHLDYDYVGTSYYSYWHGTFETFFNTMDAINKLTNKPIWVVEYAYAFTQEDYINTGNNQMVTIFNGAITPMPLTKEGQKEHVKTFISLCKAHSYIKAIFYWEPLWLPLEHTYWATIEGQEYINETGKSQRNEWSNQCLYDYNGNALPALDEFKE